MKHLAPAMALAIAAATLAPLTQAGAQEVTGAGATFPAPVYTKWGEAAKAPTGLSLNYQAIGSGGGVNQITNRTVDFGASDAPVAADKLAAAKLLQFPAVMGAVVPIVNVPGVEIDQLMLTGDLLAQIYDGGITMWNDPKIAAINKAVKLPALAIAVIHRADASGTSYVWTSYLSAANAKWKADVGAKTDVAWPTGAGAKGNDGVGAQVKNIKGAIGYVENAYATNNKLTTTQLQNKAGKFVKPTIASFQAAAAGADWAHAENFAVSLIDQPGDTAWPIVSATFIELPRDAKDLARTQNVIKFFDWAYTSGDAIASSLEYVPLPASVKAQVRAAWKTVQG